MVRRAQLQRKPGSPLISGYLTPKGIPWGRVIAVVALLVVLGAGIYYAWGHIWLR